MVGILELHARLQRRLGAQVRQQLGAREKRPPVQKLTGIRAIARHARTVRQQLANAGAGQVLVQAIDIAANGVIQPDLALLAQQQDARCGEGLECEAMRRRCRGKNLFQGRF